MDAALETALETALCTVLSPVKTDRRYLPGETIELPVGQVQSLVDAGVVADDGGEGEVLEGSADPVKDLLGAAELLEDEQLLELFHGLVDPLNERIQKPGSQLPGEVKVLIGRDEDPRARLGILPGDPDVVGLVAAAAGRLGNPELAVLMTRIAETAMSRGLTPEDLLDLIDPMNPTSEAEKPGGGASQEAPAGETDKPEEVITLTREQHLVAQCQQIDPGNPELWTKGGKPQVAALEAATGLADISAKERDAAWEKFQAEREKG